VYGSLIAVMMPWFVWRHKLPGLALCDLVAPSMVLGLALGLTAVCRTVVAMASQRHPVGDHFPANSLPYATSGRGTT
jgi:hypothetical protein